MYKINKVVKNKMYAARAKKIKNEEGYTVYKMRDDQALFLEASSFVPRNSFYLGIKTKLENFEKLIDKLIATEPQFVVALAWYLGKIMGIRLSPVIMVARLYSAGTYCKRTIHEVFTRPDFLANFLSYWKGRIPGGLKSIRKEVLLTLRKTLESYGELTLKRRKMLNREFKLKDLIKILKPKPATSEMSLLYKAIIEDSKRSKLVTVVNKETGKVESSEHTTAAISDDRVSYKEKQEFVKLNVSKLPINSLIKNLSFLEGNDAGKLKTRLTSLFQDGSAMRFINPFDLIFLESIDHRNYNKSVRVPQEIEDVCDEVLKKFISFECKAQMPVILYDRSGSMEGEGHRTGSKFLSMLNGLFTLRDFRFYTFASKNYGGYGASAGKIRNNTILPAGIEDVTSNFIDMPSSFGPNAIAKTIQNLIVCNGGTELMNAVEWTVKCHPLMDLFIIITDEATWADEFNIEAYRRVIPDHLAGKVLLINVAPNQKSIFKPSAKIVRISGLDGKIIKMIEALVDFDSFKKRMIEQYEAKD